MHRHPFFQMRGEPEEHPSTDGALLMWKLQDLSWLISIFMVSWLSLLSTFTGVSYFVLWCFLVLAFWSDLSDCNLRQRRTRDTIVDWMCCRLKCTLFVLFPQWDDYSSFFCLDKHWLRHIFYLSLLYISKQVLSCLLRFKQSNEST